MTMQAVPSFYFAHPVGHGPSRPQNLMRAKLWIRALVELIPDVAFSAPWLPYVEVLDESRFRARGIRDDLVNMIRCDGIVATGGWSPGVLDEWQGMTSKRRIDLISHLPSDPMDVIDVRREHAPTYRAIIMERFQGAFT